MCREAQCGNYGNSLSRIFGENFVKVTVLLNKLLKSWFDEIFFRWAREREFLDFPHWFRNFHSTVWKFQDFSDTQILREINFGEFRSSKTAAFAIFRSLNFADLVNFSLPKRTKNHKKLKFRVPNCVKMVDFDILDLSTLISREIWVTEFCSFHTVHFQCF